jgi:hypothetical protein
MKILGFLLAAALCSNGETFRVAGAILNSETAQPVRKARMSLTATGKSRTFVTGSDGRFDFEVPPGKYTLSADVNEMRQNYGLRTPNAGFGIAVVAGPGQNTSDLVFRWFPPAALAGAVIDQFGQPVERAKVSLIRIVVLSGRKRVYFYGARYTDDRGEYRFGPISPGSYYLTVTGEPWYASTAVPARSNPRSTTFGSAAYPTMYYPGTHDPRAAAPFFLKPGQEGRADFTLDETRGVSVTVNCDGGPSVKTLALMEDGVNGFQDAARQLTVYAGGTVIPSVPSGRYGVRVTATDNGREMAAWQVIQVGSSDIDVALTLKPAPSIVGTVEFKDPSTKPHGTITVRMTYDVTGFVVARTVSPDGSFSASLLIGKYEVLGVNGDFTSDIFGEDGAPHEGFFDLTPGPPAKIHIVASDGTSRVKGFVKLDDHPLEGVIVVLTTRKESERRGNYRAFQTDSDGSFDMQSVRPGDYYLFAVDAPELEWANPAALRPYFAGAKPIRIEPHKTYDESIDSLARPSVP